MSVAPTSLSEALIKQTHLLVWAIDTLGQAWLRAGTTAVPGSRPAKRPSMARARLDLWKLRRAFARVAQTDSLEAVGAEFRRLAPSSTDVARAARIWIEVVESLMFDVELRYGHTTAGSFKKQRARSALLYWFRQSGIELPLVPQFLQPFAFEAASDWIIEAIYVLVHDKGQWTVAGARQVERPPGVWERFINRATSLVSLTWVSARLTEWAWWRISRSIDLSPRQRQAIDALGKETQLAMGGFGRDTRLLIVWLNNHQRQVIALIQLISVAVHEAESFLDMSGPEKKAYAHDLVLAYLIEEDLIVEGSLLYVMADSLVGWLIDTVVGLFNKREHFVHRHSSASDVAAADVTLSPPPRAKVEPDSESLSNSKAAGSARRSRLADVGVAACLVAREEILFLTELLFFRDRHDPMVRR